MELRLSRKKWKIASLCIVCSKKADENHSFSIKYAPDVPVAKEDKDFTLNIPLCAEHFQTYSKGKKYFKRSLLLFATSLIPFLVGAGLNDHEQYKGWAIGCFLGALFLCVAGYIFFEISHKLSEATVKNKVKIKWITDTEIILDVSNSDWVNLQKKS